VFPRATTFGWTKSAPGEIANSEVSLLYHIAHMAEINNYLHRGIMIDPLKDPSSKDAIELADAVLDILQKPNRNECERTSIKAWRAQGFNLKNYDLNAYPSYESTNDKDMVAAKEIGCRFKNAKTQSERIEALNLILTSRKLIAANFSSLIELTQNQNLSPQERSQILSLMKGSASLKSFVGDKFNSPHVGLFAKIDYYAYYRNVFGVSDSAQQIITDQSYNFLIRPYPPKTKTNEYLDVVDYNATLTSALAKNRLVTKSLLERLASFKSEMSNDQFRFLYNKMIIVPGYEALAEEFKSQYDHIAH
jgi:hypothetical protein